MRPATSEEIGVLPYNDPFKDGTLNLFFVPEDDSFMQKAYEARKKSTDKNHSTGAVIISEQNIVSSESNQVGFKQPFLIRLHELGWCVRKWLKIPSGQKYWLCPGCAKSYDHAESRASRIAGDKAKGGTLYLAGHWWCCKPCSDSMIKAGITKVVLPEGAKQKYGK